NPFAHFVLHGAREGRKPLPYARMLARRPWAPRVTCIIPNYNHARFLPQRIDSVLAQTYENLEILILDDCSTDDSRAVIEDYARAHPSRIRYDFNTKNSGGVFHQWRKGITAAGGELIWICESDDFCEPGFLERCIAP